jgi:hypothetical protein
MGRNPWLVAGGLLSAAAALLHLATIVGGGDWYRFFGAGEALASADERGSWVPAALTLGIAMLLGLWALYAFAGAGLIRRLPLMRTALVLISLIYVARGLMVLDPVGFSGPGLSPSFVLWSSLIVLTIGLTYAIGTWRGWSFLSLRTAE